MTMYTADNIRSMRIAPSLNRDYLMAGESDYVVVVPYKGQNGPSERVAYGYTMPLTKRAALQLLKAVQPHYKGKSRAIMLKTALKSLV